MWRHIDGPSWIQYDLFRKIATGSKSRQSLYSFNLYATNRDIRQEYNSDHKYKRKPYWKISTGIRQWETRTRNLPLNSDNVSQPSYRDLTPYYALVFLLTDMQIYNLTPMVTVSEIHIVLHVYHKNV